jgi:hypothetical protein
MRLDYKKNASVYDDVLTWTPTVNDLLITCSTQTDPTRESAFYGKFGIRLVLDKECCFPGSRTLLMQMQMHV